jgi:hypothetical protein
MTDIIMPYFKDLNLLYIHIPKTGGTSIEKYFYKNRPQTLSSLISHSLYPEYDYIKINNHSLQHCTYREFYDNREYFGINFDDNLTILSSIRHPYSRLISDLFYFKLINSNTSTEEVLEKIKYFLDPVNADRFDNHHLPQYCYLIDKDGNIPEKIAILNQDTLTEDMHKIGCTDFNIKTQITDYSDVDYFQYFTPESIKVVNEYYKKDFEYFGYKSIDLLLEGTPGHQNPRSGFQTPNPLPPFGEF